MTKQSEGWRQMLDTNNDLRARITELKTDVIDLRHNLECSSRKQDELEAALEIIAGKRQCLDNTMSNSDIAKAALGWDK